MLDFGQFDFGQLAEIELVAIGRSRNWPKSKLIGRSRTDGVCSVSSFSLSSFFSLCFYFSSLFSCSYSSLSSFCFCAVSGFRPQKPELNPKPQTLHPISAGPFRWTPPSGDPPPPPPDNPPPDKPPPDNPPPDNPPPDNPPPDNPPPDRPKFRSFFSRLAHDSPKTPNVHISGPRRFKHHQNSTQGPQEREKRKKIVAEEGKKARNFGPPTLLAPPFGAPFLSGGTSVRRILSDTSKSFINWSSLCMPSCTCSVGSTWPSSSSY